MQKLMNSYRWPAGFLLSALLAACGDLGNPPPASLTAGTRIYTGLDHGGSLGPLLPLREFARSNDGRLELGRTLFKDPRLSRDGSISCASCHDVTKGGDDGLATAIGIDGAVGPLNTPTVLNAGHNFAQFWDGRAASLEEQVSGPVHNPIEMASDWEQVIAKLRADPSIVAAFRKAYSDGLTPDNIIDAIATYERALVTTESSFDRFLLGDRSAISSDAKKGYQLFLDIGCASCHQGRNIGGNMFQRFGVMGDYFADRGNVSESDLGRYNVTKREDDRYFFKVPSLRNVADTAPYFHDGSVGTLEQAVRIMAEYQLGHPISDREVRHLVSFLRTLSGTLDPELI